MDPPDQSAPTPPRLPAWTSWCVSLVGRLVGGSVRRPGLVVALAALSIPVSVALASRITVRLDGGALLVDSHPGVDAMSRARELFGVREDVMAAVTPASGDVLSPAGRRSLRRVVRGLAGLPGLVPGSVRSLESVSLLLVRGDTLHRSSAAAGRWSPGMTREAVRRMGLDDGLLLSPDHATAVAVAGVRPAADRRRLLGDLRDLRARVGGDGTELRLAGSAVAQAALGEAVRHDLLRLVPAVCLLLLVILALVYRNPVPAVLVLGEVAVSLLWAAAVMGGAGGTVYITTLVLPLVILTIGIADDVYALNAYIQRLRRDRGDRPPEATLLEALRSVATPVVLTTATTAAALLTLATVGIGPLRTFGLYGALALAFSTLLTFTLIPALVVLLPGTMLRPGWAHHRRAARSWVGFLHRWAARHPRGSVLLGAGAACAGLVVATGLTIEDSWIRNIPASSELATDAGVIDARAGGTTALELHLRGPRAGYFGSPEGVAVLVDADEAAAAVPGVGAVHGRHRSVLRVLSALRGREAPDDAGAAAGASGPELRQASLLLETSTASRPDRYLAESGRSARLTVLLRSGSYRSVGEAVDAVRESVRAASRGAVAVTPFGASWRSRVTVGLLVERLVASVALALLLDLVLVSLALGSWRVGVATVLPVAVSVALVFAGLAAAGIPLGIASSMFAAVALGIGVDHAIHLACDFREALSEIGRGLPALTRSFARSAPAISTSSAALAGGFSVLAFSVVPPNALLGILLTASVVVSAAATLALSPGLLLRLGAAR